MNGYDALHDSAAWLDVSTRGRIRVTGDDRVRLLHAMTTNDVKALLPGQTHYTFFLNAQGRILADAFITCHEDHLLIDTEPETRAKVYEHLDKFIIADDVTLEDVTDQTAAIAIHGPAAASVSAAGLVIVPLAGKAALVESLSAIPNAGEAAFRTFRIENGIPRYGEEITERYLVQETGQMHAVAFNKGCYLGQEIVERVRSRAQIHRRLLPLEIETQTPPAAGTKFQSQGKDAAEIASAVYSPRKGLTAALAYVRIDFNPGDRLESGGVSATVMPEPPGRSPVSAPSR